jgi:lipid-A-disaccharide synthase
MIVAGEASGDLHGAALCEAIRALSPGARVFGMGGARMRAAGAELLADVSREAGVGTTEVVSSVPGLYRVFRRLRALLEREPPSVLVLIDFPEFNLRLARAAHRARVPVVYFIPPQIWVWRRGRIRTIRRLVSLVLAIFPFERALYRDAGVPVEFVGHPLVDALTSAPSRREARRRLGLDEDSLVIGLLPGSRHGEAASLLPLMRAAAGRLLERRPRARFVLAQAPTLADGLVERALAGGPPVRVVRDAAHAVMRASDLLLVASGTATLESAMLGTPMVVCYRVSRVSELMGRLLIRVPWINLVNLVLGRAVVPELRLRRELTLDRLVDEAWRLLESEAARDAQRAAFDELHGQLGEPGVAMRAAQSILGGGLRPPSDARRSPEARSSLPPPRIDGAGKAGPRPSKEASTGFVETSPGKDCVDEARGRTSGAGASEGSGERRGRAGVQ